MILHYLTTALANFRKTPFTTAANVLTLALGLACFIAAFGIATYWRSADGYHDQADRTFLVGQSFGSPDDLSLGSTAVLARYLQEEFPEVEDVARIRSLANLPVVAGDAQVLVTAGFADPAFLDIFDLDFIAGDSGRALAEPGGVILTAETAARLFGDRPALGESLRVGGQATATVTGVVAPVRTPSFMSKGATSVVPFDVLAHWTLLPQGAVLNASDGWVSTDGLTFVRLSSGTAPEQINARMGDFVQRRIPDSQRALVDMGFTALRMKEILSRRLDGMLLGDNPLNLTVVQILVGLGGLILLVAGVNYANLAAAQAGARTRELGMRRVLGGDRVDAMLQSWIGTGMLSLLALVVALGALIAAARPLERYAGVDLLYFLGGGFWSWAIIFGLTAGVVLAAGAWPALIVSKVRPADAARSRRAPGGHRGAARILVGVQFAAASFLLILLSVMHLQRAHLERIALAPVEDPLIVLGDIRPLGISDEQLAAQLTATPGVRSVTFVDRQPWDSGGSRISLTRLPEVGASEVVSLRMQVGEDYFQTLGLPLLGGRGFDRVRDSGAQGLDALNPSSPIPMVADRALLERLGYATPEEAVGEVIYLPESWISAQGGEAAQPVRLIGAVESDLARIAQIDAVGQTYFFGSGSAADRAQFPIVRVAPENLPATLENIGQAWRRLSPDTPPNLRFYDELFDEAYQQFSRVNRLFSLLAGMTFAIACLGLLGIAVHVAARRRHEIAVRKTLGSTTWGAVRLLLADFSKPVIVANLIAWPLGYLAAETYLSAFAHRINLSIWPFALSMLITLAIAWLAVGGQTYRAASVRPAQVLRDA